MTIKLTEDEVRNCSWTFSHQDENYRYWIGKGTHPKTGVPIEVLKKEYLEDENLQVLNHEERVSRDARRWSQGSGSEKGGNVPMVRVARTPLSVFYDQLAPRIKQGDKDFERYWLNHERNAPFRTRSGRV